MKKLLAAGSVVVLMSVAAIAAAQPWQGGNGRGGWGMRGQSPGMYDPAKAETVSGEVVAVEQVSPGRRKGMGIGLKLKVGSETVMVHLGPQWYIEQQDIKIAAGDRVEVKGVKIERWGREFLMAAEVKKGSEVLQLRDEKGFPVWAGCRQGPNQ